MNKFDLIGELRTYCTSNGIYFIAGNDAYVNAINDYTVYDEYDLILCADLNLDFNFNNSVVDTVVYSGTLALGRKCEETTTSSLDETFDQKYDNRLKDLTEKLAQMLREILCRTEGEMQSCSVKYDINKFDLNADFVAAQISMRI